MRTRGFILSAMASVALLSGCAAEPAFKQTYEAPTGDIRAFFINLGHNMWCDWPTAQMGEFEEAVKLLPENKRPDLKLVCQDSVWRRITDYAAAKGINMLVVDLGEGVQYPSHPELAIEGSWSVEKMRAEISRLNGLGIEVIPKLNFSAYHNGWLKDYRHMISSPTYYKVCEEVITDAMEIFGNPRFFHIGFDEEDYEHQQRMAYQCIRTGEVWWADFLFFVRTVEKLGARPWAWADYGWYHPDFFDRCPKNVILQNWYYDECNGGFDPNTNNTDDHPRLLAFWRLEEKGFDQVPCGSNWVGAGRRAAGVNADDGIGRLVKTCRKVISKDHLYGFMMAPWGACTEAEQDFMLRGLDLFEEVLNSQE